MKANELTSPKGTADKIAPTPRPATAAAPRVVARRRCQAEMFKPAAIGAERPYTAPVA